MGVWSWLNCTLVEKDELLCRCIDFFILFFDQHRWKLGFIKQKKQSQTQKKLVSNKDYFSISEPTPVSSAFWLISVY